MFNSLNKKKKNNEENNMMENKNMIKPSELINQKLKGNVFNEKIYKPKIIGWLNIGDFSFSTKSSVPIDKPLFNPLPSVIYFTDYEPLINLNKSFKLRNQDTVARRVRIVQPESRLFQVFYDNKLLKNDKEGNIEKYPKIAPGLEINFTIKFSPEAKIDYKYDLEIYTEREKFIVPIIAIGKRAIIDFPDKVDFGSSCPVKYMSEKPVIIRNIGEKTTKWELILPQAFLADKKEGVLEYGASEQIILKFYPMERKLYESQAMLIYDENRAVVELIGHSINGNVNLSKNIVQLSQAYISLETQQTLQIINKSNVKIDFQWRAFPTEKEEIEKKLQLKEQLENEEDEKRILIKETVNFDFNNDLLDIPDDDNSGYEETDEKMQMLRKQKKAELLLQRKYKNIKKAIEDDPLIFEDDIFKIEPDVGTIWPNSEMTITVTFRPQAALKYSCKAYCNISCSDERLKLHLEGEGLGPKAFLSTNSVSIGDVYVNEEHSNNLSLENKGQIPAKFELIRNNTPFSKMIEFEIDKGKLEVSQRLNIAYKFKSSKVGEFQEIFRWKLEGSTEMLNLLFRGHVRAPNFEFNVDKIDFGLISFNFDKTETISITNTSTVSFDYELRIPGDGRNGAKEFEINYPRGTIGARNKKDIVITLIPTQKKQYNLVLVIDIIGVGKDMRSIPITAISEVPEIEVSPKEINYGVEFIRNPIKKYIYLKNNSSNLQAKFTVHPQNPDTLIYGRYTPIISSGIIDGDKTQVIEFNFITNTKNVFNLEIVIEIASNVPETHTVKLFGRSKGPDVSIEPQKELSFGEVNVLRDYHKKFKLINIGKIDADFFILTKSENSIFKPIQRHDTLPAGNSMDIEVVCTADDKDTFRDILYVIIKEGEDKNLLLSAKGVGSTLFCKEDLNHIDFSTIYTYRNQIKEIFVENKGRRQQKLTWVKKGEDGKKKGKELNNDKKGKSKNSEEETPVFQIYPDTIVLPPKTGIMYQFKAYSQHHKRISETYVLNSVLGSDNNATELYKTTIEGIFIKPSLSFSKTKVLFKYKWEKNITVKKMSQNIEIKCICDLPTAFDLKTEKPFEVSPGHFSLLSKKSAIAKIEFDPKLKTDKISGFITKKLQIKYSKHPHIENIELVGELCFPNLKLETSEINFGSVMNDTSKKIMIKIFNISEMIVNYEWSFLKDENDYEEENLPPINEVFDILPLNGTLEPNQSEIIEFSYYGIPNKKFSATAICRVEGGPDYEIKLYGEASTIAYKLHMPQNNNIIDFGEVIFNQWIYRDFYIENLGKVPFEYFIKIEETIRRKMIIISLQEGKVIGKSKNKIRISICPSLPGEYNEIFKINVAHFEPEKIIIRGFGLSPSIKLNLPRIKNELINKIQNEMQINDSNITDDQYLKKFDNNILSEIDTKILYEEMQKKLKLLNENLPNSIANNQSKNEGESMVSRGQNSLLFNDKIEKKMVEGICLGNFILDFGDVIAGAKLDHTIKIYNIGKLPLNINFNLKKLKDIGFSLTNSKIMKLSNKDNINVNIKLTFQTKKVWKPGKNLYSIPIEIGNGPHYNLDVIANITIPEIEVSSKDIDFGKVLCGQKKTIYVKLFNNKEVLCEWWVSNDKDRLKDENKFLIIPNMGKIKRCSKSIVEIIFFPNQDKLYNQKFVIELKDSHKKVELFCKGFGILPQLDFITPEMVFKPCFPYENIYNNLEIKNNSEFDTELFCSDFDNLIFEEEKKLLKYDPIFKGEKTLNIRNAGDKFWKEIEDYISIEESNKNINEQINNLKIEIESLEGKLVNLEENMNENDAENDEENNQSNEIDEKDNLKNEIDNLKQEIGNLENSKLEHKKPEKPIIKIDDKKKRNIILIGPKKSHKTQLINFISRIYKKGVVNFNELLEWNINFKTEIGSKSELYLKERMEELNKKLLEKEKKKKKKDAEEINEKDYEILPNEYIEELLKQRILYKDCNGGVIFDNLESNFSSSIENTINIISSVMKDTNLQLIILNYNKFLYEENLEEEEEKIDNIDHINEDFIYSFLNKIENKNNKKSSGSNLNSKNQMNKGNNERFQIIKNSLQEVKNPEKLSEDEIKLYNDYKELVLNTFLEKKLDSKNDSINDNENKEVEIINLPLKKTYNEFNCQNNYMKLNYGVISLIPEPEFPDPLELPLPKPKLEQIIKKPNSKRKFKTLNNFTVYTPEKNIKEDIIEDMINKQLEEFLNEKNNQIIEIQEKINNLNSETLTEKIQVEIKNLNKNILEIEQEISDKKRSIFNDWIFKTITPNMDNLIESTRWIIPAKKSWVLVVKFFSSRSDNFNEIWNFETIFTQNKPYNYKLKACCEFPKLNGNIVNIFSLRRNRRNINLKPFEIIKSYIIQENLFEFGPLLIGKNKDSIKNTEIMKINSYTFGLTNNGKFPCEIEFTFASESESENNEKNKEQFIIENNKIMLNPEETYDLRVWALPQFEERIKDDLLCIIKDNPIPLIIPMACYGCRPIIKLLVKEIEFERQLLKKISSRTILIKNEGYISGIWKLLNTENLPKEFILSETNGILKPDEEKEITIEFSSDKQIKLNEVLEFEVIDVEKNNIKGNSDSLTLKAEAFDIFIELKNLTDDDKVLLDFENVMVGNPIIKNFNIKNLGTYSIKYEFFIPKKYIREILIIEPSEGTLESGKEENFKVTFQSNKEININTLQGKQEIFLKILEGNSLEKYNEININIKVNSEFNKYQVLPFKNLNFGPLVFNEVKEKKLEIYNDGLFEFNFQIYDYHNDEIRKQIVNENLENKEIRIQELLKNEIKKNKDKKPQKEKKKNDENQINLGQFKLSPFKGNIPAGSSCEIQITFNGKDDNYYKQKLGIEISDRNPLDNSNGILYELTGESCIPSINISNYKIIFEEQIVVPTLNQTGQNIQELVNSNVFCIEENCFYFGTLIPSKYPNGITERFKISNFGKVHSQVSFNLKKKTNQDLFAFEIYPKTAKIPPHEHVYVKITFKPNIMAQYEGIFEAIVENGDTNFKNSKLSFDLRGEGALPTLKIDKQLNNDGVLVLNFGKIRKNNKKVLPITLKNDGLIPSTTKIDFIHNNNFKLIDQNTYTVTPKTQWKFYIEFNPIEVGEFKHEFKLNTLLNPYENSNIELKGESYFERISFEKLPHNEDDILDFEDCIINQANKISFYVKNNTNNQLRLNWIRDNIPEDVLILIKPIEFHLDSQMSKKVIILLKSNIKINLNTFIDLKLIDIKHKKTYIDWDTNKKIKRYITKTEEIWLEECNKLKEQFEEEMNKIKQMPKQPKNLPKLILPDKPEFSNAEIADILIQENKKEPEYENLENEKLVKLNVIAKVDNVNYECDIDNIFFKKTMMFTSRYYNFKIKNPGLVSINYYWIFINPETNEIDNGFYDIIPQNGQIKSGSIEEFTIKFIPTEVNLKLKRILNLKIQDLDKNMKELCIMVNGTVERPICHFELPINDNIGKNRIVEIQSIGIKVKNYARFYVVNPTSTSYEFLWIKIDNIDNKNDQNYIKCQTQKGVILSGKKFEMIFEYYPETNGNHSENFKFLINKHKIEQNFIIKGKIIEPKVFFEKGKIDFGPLLIGGKNSDKLILKNLDYIPYKYNFLSSTISGKDYYGNSLFIKPMKGEIAPQSEKKLEIDFIPKIEGEYNYNVICKVNRKSQNLNINIKGIGYLLHHSVLIQNPKTTLMPNESYNFNFNQLYVNEQLTKKILIVNKGDFNFDYVFKKKGTINYISTYPESATVKKNESVEVEITFNPLEKYILRPNLHSLILNIISGPKYTFKLSGNAKKPNIYFSFNEYDFGYCFNLKTPLKQKINLQIKNLDKTSMTIETDFEKKNYLDIQLPSGQVWLPYNSSINNDLIVPITFTPRKMGKYEEIIEFNINGLQKIPIKIKGEGIPLKLELVNQENNMIDFGIKALNSNMTKQIKIFNSSKKSIKISFDLNNQLEELRKNGIFINPHQKKIIIESKEKLEIDITFNPKIRLNYFKYDLNYMIIENSEIQRLLTIQGCCQGIEVKLLEETLSFGSIIIGSKLKKTIQMNNTGDIGVNYNWDFGFSKQYFEISQVKGLIPANDSRFFDITFTPISEANHEFKIKCNIENSIPIFLSLYGKGILSQKEEAKEVNFVCNTRKENIQTIQLNNPTNTPWRIKSKFTTQSSEWNNYFNGNENIEIKANSNVNYDIYYKPLTMTKNDENQDIANEYHYCQLFFPLPNGNAYTFNLKGKSNPPEIEEMIEETIVAKYGKNIIIKIKNWLEKTQTFNISWDLESQERNILVNGAKTIDVKGKSFKDYKLFINGIKKGNNKIMLRFNSLNNKEYLLYKINVKIDNSEPIGPFELISPIREKVSSVLIIENLLEENVEITENMFVIEDENVSIYPNKFTVKGKSEYGFEIFFRPLLIKEYQTKIKIVSNEWGELVYLLKLKGIKSQINETLNFKTNLGLETLQTFKFINYVKKPLVYTAKIENIGNDNQKKNNKGQSLNDFIIDNSNVNAIAAQNENGAEISVNIRYEPSMIGYSKSLLIINSQEGGEYQCYLIGQSNTPLPKGPFNVSSKGFGIDFKNPFFESKEFNINVNNKAFIVSQKNPIKVEGKKTIKISISYNKSLSNESKGNLTIKTEGMPKWTFYLEGE